MKCPSCADDTKVIETRESADSTRRRRECLSCQERFTTYERFDQNLIIIKKDGRKDKFCTEKLEKGITLACEKRPITNEQISTLIRSIEQQLRENYKEVKTSIVGELVMDKLRELDEVAYIRFASVYRNFKDPESFLKEVDNLNKQKEGEEIECKL